MKRPTSEMTVDELREEYMDVNRRIAYGKEHAKKNREKALWRLKNMPAYLEAMKKLYE